MAAPSRSIDVQFNAPQFRAFSAVQDRRSVFLGFGRGVGKSHWLRTNIYTKVAQHDGVLRANAAKRFRGVRFVFFMPTLVQFKDVHWSDFENDLLPGGDWDWLKAKLDRQRGQITFPGGSWIKPFPSTMYNSKAGRGVRCDGIVCDECDDTEIDAYDSVAIPWLSEPYSFGWEWISGTPTRGRYGLWYRSLIAGRLASRIRRGELSPASALETDAAKSVREVFEVLDPKNWPAHLPRDVDAATIAILESQYAIHATYRDAPETVSPHAVAQAKAKMSAATFKREWEADPDAGEGLVYSVFDEQFHVKEPPPNLVFDEYHVGMDHGDVDPGTLILGATFGSGEHKTLWLLAEHYGSGIPNHVWDERALAWWRRYHARHWPDSARPDRVRDLRGKGIDCGDVEKGPGSVLAGIARVSDLLFIRRRETQGPAFQPVVEHYSRLYVSPRCVHTIEEFGKYRRKKRPDGTFQEDPEDKDNHCMDGVRYMSVGIFGRLPNARHIAPGR